jgi:hypothetical protein
MKRTITAAGLTALALALAIGGASGHGFDVQGRRVLEPAEPSAAGSSERAGETLWIYAEDFEDPFTDEWTVLDLSGIAAQENYWHIDTIRPKDGAGDHSWWCGTDNSCWAQPRGYANGWHQLLSRHFAGVTGTGVETVEIEFDQRFAMEKDYDYGYVDISDDGGDSWITLAAYTNASWIPGTLVDWDDPTYGHVVLDVSSYSGSDIDLRFRFESDSNFSSADNANVLVEDGAWQLDNIEIQVDDIPAFSDGCESGDTGWSTEALPSSGQTGVVWRRGQYGIDFVTGRPDTVGAPPIGSYMFAPVDTATSKMVDSECTWLISPPIYVGGRAQVICKWYAWIDLPSKANDVHDIWFRSSDDIDCVRDHTSFLSSPGAWFGGPFWWASESDIPAGNNWLAIAFSVENYAPPEDGAEHMGGFFLDDIKIGSTSHTGVVDSGSTNLLSQASPNPFNPVTRIAYSVVEAGPVAIEVYNVAGNVVRTLLDAELRAGSKGEVIWDGANDLGERCASGVYFYRMSASGVTTMRKMVLLK